ncbi:hypothetical protein [Coleofasciculus sp. H7-2]
MLLKIARSHLCVVRDSAIAYGTLRQSPLPQVGLRNTTQYFLLQ